MAAKRPVTTSLSLYLRYQVKSVHEIDHLIEGLRGVRKKLDNDGDRLQREIEQYTAFSQSIIELTKIVSDGMTIVNKSNAV
jgi:hypothetical protein